MVNSPIRLMPRSDKRKVARLNSRVLHPVPDSERLSHLGFFPGAARHTGTQPCLAWLEPRPGPVPSSARPECRAIAKQNPNHPTTRILSVPRRQRPNPRKNLLRLACHPFNPIDNPSPPTPGSPSATDPTGHTNQPRPAGERSKVIAPTIDKMNQLANLAFYFPTSARPA